MFDAYPFKKNFTTLHLGHLRSSPLLLALIVFENVDDLFVNTFLLFFPTNIGSLTDSSCIINMDITCRYTLRFIINVDYFVRFRLFDNCSNMFLLG